MITITTTSPEEARAMVTLMSGAPAAVDFRVFLLGREVNGLTPGLQAAGRAGAAR